MVVRKKKLDSPETRDRLDLSPHLDEVRKAIRALPTEPTEEEPAMAATKKATKKSATNGAAKKDTTSLADICKDMKKEPRWARRVLRNAEYKNPGHRWDFPKGEVSKVTKILKDAAAS